MAHFRRLAAGAVLLAAWAGAGCRRVPRTPLPAECPATPPAGAREVDAAALARLPGAYRLVVVHTAAGGGHAVRGTVELAPNDTLARYYMEAGGGRVRRGDRPFAGRVRWDNGWSDTAIAVGRALGVGCPVGTCNDAGATVYLIDAAWPAGFRGTWEGSAGGFAVVVGQDGRREPPPAGYFCLLRAGP